jgi:hypothetical protein
MSATLLLIAEYPVLFARVVVRPRQIPAGCNLATSNSAVYYAQVACDALISLAALNLGLHARAKTQPQGTHKPPMAGV